MARQPSSSMHLNTKMIDARNLTTATSNAVHKLQAAVELYRVKNYSQELPSRCKKEIVQAANVNKDNCIEEQDLFQILRNIGAQDIVSESDLRNIILELGDKQNNTISVHQLINIL
jgi:Ca2+-binding EF-hand superfamily protein